MAGVFRLLSDVFNMCSPMLVREIILYTRGEATLLSPLFARGGGSGANSLTGGAALAALLFAVVLAQAVALQQFIHGVFMVGGSGAGGAGRVVNLLAKDASQLREFVVFAHNLWASPLTAVGCTFLLYTVLGPSGLVGVSLIPLLIPLESWVSRVSERHRRRVLAFADARVSLVAESIDAIKTVKLLVLGGHVREKVAALRREELTAIRRALQLSALNQAVMRASP
ncbi:unnamed protein product, partial [Phaeothamnion confervicola]